jgi:hypothetical protein
MKENIKISKTANRILISIFLLVILSAVIFFTRNWLRWDKEIDSLKAEKINSKIVELKDLQRGSYLIGLKVGSNTIQFSLPIAFEVRRDHIQVGDSLSKPAGSKTCEIFRIQPDGQSVKISEITIP